MALQIRQPFLHAHDYGLQYYSVAHSANTRAIAWEAKLLRQPYRLAVTPAKEFGGFDRRFGHNKNIYSATI